MAEKMKIKVLEPTMKEIKTEKKKEEVSELEQEVSDESIISQMPRGNFNTSIPVNMRGQELDESLDSIVPQTRNENTSSSSSQTAYGGNQDTHATLEAKYQVSSLASQRMQTAINMARERENSRTLNFENPELRQFGASQSGDDDYQSRMGTTDVSVKRRNHWEGG